MRNPHLGFYGIIGKKAKWILVFMTRFDINQHDFIITILCSNVYCNLPLVLVIGHHL